MAALEHKGVGVLYICFGVPYVEFATLSVFHLRRFGYTGAVRVLTDAPQQRLQELDCELVLVPSPGSGFATRYYKTQLNQFAFDTTMFVDADAIPIASIKHIWRELRFADICMSLDLHPSIRDLIGRSALGYERRQAEYRHMDELGLLDRPFFSSGVILFRRTPAVEELFAAWHEEWLAHQHEDQLALTRAIARTGCLVHTLAPRWNERLKRFGTVEAAQSAGTRILHLRPRLEPVPETLLEVHA